EEAYAKTSHVVGNDDGYGGTGDQARRGPTGEEHGKCEREDGGVRADRKQGGGYRQCGGDHRTDQDAAAYAAALPAISRQTAEHRAADARSEDHQSDPAGELVRREAVAA